MQGLPNIKWWQSLLLSFGITSAALAIPIQVIIVKNYNKPALFPSVLAIILIVLAYQIAPTALLFAVERSILRFIGVGRALNIFWGVVFAAASLLLLRSLLSSFDLGSKAPFLRGIAGGLAVAGIAIIAIVAIWLFLPHRIIAEYFMALGVVALIWTGVFVYQMELYGKAAVALPNPSKPAIQLSEPLGGPVFILLFDGLGGDVLLKDGRLDSEKLPNFTALGRDSAVFLNATSNYRNTNYSVATMFNGRFTTEGDPCIDRIGSCPTDIFSVLSSKGHQVSVYHEALGCNTGSLRCFGQTQVIEKYPARFVTQMGLLLLKGPPALQRIYPWRVSYGIGQFNYHLYSQPLFSEFLGDIKSPSGGSVFYVHLLLSHDPYVFDKNGKRHIPLWPETDYERMEQAYREQVQFLDTKLGEFIARLKGEGLYDKAVIIITGDHGPRPFSNRDGRFPQEINGVIPQVPLIIKGPNIKPQVSFVDYQHVDFKPTLLDILALPTEDGLQGVSAFAPQRPEREKVFYYPIPPSRRLGKFVYQGATGRWALSE